MSFKLEKATSRFDRKYILPPHNKWQELAEELHANFCWLDHNEDCGWLYEKSWSDRRHQRWESIAVDIDDLVDDIIGD